eukprot:15432911-Alexandrium_andersonii.AAC.1
MEGAGSWATLVHRAGLTSLSSELGRSCDCKLERSVQRASTLTSAHVWPADSLAPCQDPATQ